MDVSIAAEGVVESASEALSSLIGRFKELGAVNFLVFLRLFETLAILVMGYSITVPSSVESIWFRATHFIMGVGRLNPIIKQELKVI